MLRHSILLLFSFLWTAHRLRGHPASIAEYPERFPGKTLQEIRREWEPPPKDAWSVERLAAESSSLVETWSGTAKDVLAARIERLAVENRRGDYRKRFANLALEMAELVEAEPRETAAYLRWRLEHLAEDDGYFDDLPKGHWDEKAPDARERGRQWQNERDREVLAISKQAETASTSLRPHWLVQAGALEFRHRRYREARDHFQRVVDDFPSNPRAEVAALMLVRLMLDEWLQAKRSGNAGDRSSPLLQKGWWDACRTYRERYPEGRYLLDLNGLEAGCFLESDNAHAAMELFLMQSRDPAHPEVRRRAFQQIEWMLDKTVDVEALPWDRIASEPFVALRLGYHLLDACSQTDLGAIMHRRGGEDHRALESLVPALHAVRSGATKAWIALDAALFAHADVYAGRYAAIRDCLHLWSLVMRGQAPVALGMETTKASGPGADDLDLARLFALIKAGRPADAVETIARFQRAYPHSSLNRGLTLRRIDALVDLGEFSPALSLLYDMVTDDGTATPGAAIRENPPLNLPGEPAQRMAAILSFAPLEKLTVAVDTARERPPLQSTLRRTLRVRHLARREFEKALAFANEADFDRSVEPLEENGPTPSARWRGIVEELRRLTKQAASAASWKALGEAWQRHARLLDSGFVYLPNTYFAIGLGRPTHELRSSAAYLHLPDREAAALLDEREELSHARHCFEKAGALVLVNETLRERAELSPYWMDRAVEVADSSYSRSIVKQLAREDVVPWTFRPTSTLGEWKPGAGALWQVEAKIAAALDGGAVVEPWEQRQTVERLGKEVAGVIGSRKSPAQAAVELQTIRDELKRAAPVAAASALLNDIDDLTLLAAQPAIGQVSFLRYAEKRLARKPIPPDDAAFQSMPDFVAFWNAVIEPAVAGRETAAWRRLTAETHVARMTNFLETFPQSPKREAALARLAVNMLRSARCHCRLAAGENAYAGFTVERGGAFDRAAILKAIERYEREFPQGRYLPEMQLSRGLAAAEAEDWQEALSRLVPILNDAAVHDLHLDASNTVGSIFMMLMETDRRLAVKGAIQSVPHATEKLRLFLRTPSCAWRLRFIEGWLNTWMESPSAEPK